MAVEISLASKNTSLTTFRQVEVLFQQMYNYMYNHHLLLPLSENGAELWTKQIQKSVGRLQALVIAQDANSIIGFGVGAIRLTPDYLGNKKIGFITHIFITPEKRIHGIGKKIVNKLEEWFLENTVDSIELEVLMGNDSGIEFWKKLGYQGNLIKMRRK
jgi:ribosomal protein S18 acetylase RimI-like enzyme